MNEEKLLSIDEALVAIYQEIQQLKTMLLPQHQLSELEQRARIADTLHNVVGLSKANAMKSAGFDTSLWESPEGEKPDISTDTFNELAIAIKSLSDALKEVEEEEENIKEEEEEEEGTGTGRCMCEKDKSTESTAESKTEDTEEEFIPTRSD